MDGFWSQSCRSGINLLKSRKVLSRVVLTACGWLWMARTWKMEKTRKMGWISFVLNQRYSPLLCSQVSSIDFKPCVWSWTTNKILIWFLAFWFWFISMVLYLGVTDSEKTKDGRSMLKFCTAEMSTSKRAEKISNYKTPLTMITWKKWTASVLRCLKTRWGVFRTDLQKESFFVSNRSQTEILW